MRSRGRQKSIRFQFTFVIFTQLRQITLKIVANNVCRTENKSLKSINNRFIVLYHYCR